MRSLDPSCLFDNAAFINCSLHESAQHNMIDLRDNNGKASIAFDIVGSLFSCFMLLGGV